MCDLLLSFARNGKKRSSDTGARVGEHASHSCAHARCRPIGVVRSAAASGRQVSCRNRLPELHRHREHRNEYTHDVGNAAPMNARHAAQMSRAAATAHLLTRAARASRRLPAFFFGPTCFSSAEPASSVETRSVTPCQWRDGRLRLSRCPCSCRGRPSRPCRPWRTPASGLSRHRSCRPRPSSRAPSPAPRSSP